MPPKAKGKAKAKAKGEAKAKAKSKAAPSKIAPEEPSPQEPVVGDAPAEALPAQEPEKPPAMVSKTSRSRSRSPASRGVGTEEAIASAGASMAPVQKAAEHCQEQKKDPEKVEETSASVAQVQEQVPSAAEVEEALAALASDSTAQASSMTDIPVGYRESHQTEDASFNEAGLILDALQPRSRSRSREPPLIARLDSSIVEPEPRSEEADTELPQNEAAADYKGPFLAPPVAVADDGPASVIHVSAFGAVTCEDSDMTKAPAELAPGCHVRLQGLVAAPHLNGTTGVVASMDAKSGRWHVNLATGELKALKPENLVPFDEEAATGPVAETDPYHDTGFYTSLEKLRARAETEERTGRVPHMKDALMQDTSQKNQSDAQDQQDQQEDQDGEENQKEYDAFADPEEQKMEQDVYAEPEPRARTMSESSGADKESPQGKADKESPQGKKGEQTEEDKLAKLTGKPELARKMLDKLRGHTVKEPPTQSLSEALKQGRGRGSWIPQSGDCHAEVKNPVSPPRGPALSSIKFLPQAEKPQGLQFTAKTQGEDSGSDTSEDLKPFAWCKTNPPKRVTQPDAEKAAVDDNSETQKESSASSSAYSAYKLPKAASPDNSPKSSPKIAPRQSPFDIGRESPPRSPPKSPEASPQLKPKGKGKKGKKGKGKEKGKDLHDGNMTKFFSEDAQREDEAQKQLRDKKREIEDSKKVMLGRLTEQLQICLSRLSSPSGMSEPEREKYQDMVQNIKNQMKKISGY